MFCTIYVDASFDPPTGAAGWGMYARCEGGKLQRAAAFPERLLSSFQAELLAAVEALSLAKSTWPGLTRALVKTDCTGVLPHLALAEATGSSGPFVAAQRARLRTLGLEVIPRWVKGHQGTNTIAGWCNANADQAAREAMRRLRAGRGPAEDAVLNGLRARVRAALGARFGARAAELGTARRWAAEVLGLTTKRLKVGKLRPSQLERLERELAGDKGT